MKILINKAFSLFKAAVLCNMEYYLTHLDEIEKDLNRKINKSKLDKNNVKKLEQEPFYYQMCTIYTQLDFAVKYTKVIPTKPKINYLMSM